MALKEIELNIIRFWPDGMAARLEHVWKDVIGFIPNYKLYDLQRVLAEFGFTLKVYEQTPAGATLPDYRALYEDAMCASNEAGFVGMTAAETIRALEAEREVRAMQVFDEEAERQQFEDRAYAFYLQQREKRAAAGRPVMNDTAAPSSREQMFQRAENGNYIVWAYQAAWSGWKMARGGV